MPRGKLAAAAGASSDDAAQLRPASTSGLWLVKSEPDEFSIEDLQAKPNQTGMWDGVRNPVARNNMKAMKAGDQVFFYYSSCKVPGIVAICEVAREAYPDHTAWDPKHKYYDASSAPDKPKWFMVDLKYGRHFKRLVTLEELKGHKEGALEGMKLLAQPRLSVQPVSKEHWDFILGLESQEAPAAETNRSGKGRKSKANQAEGTTEGQEKTEAAGSKPKAGGRKRKAEQAAAAAAAGDGQVQPKEAAKEGPAGDVAEAGAEAGGEVKGPPGGTGKGKARKASGVVSTDTDTGRAVGDAGAKRRGRSATVKS